MFRRFRSAEEVFASAGFSPEIGPTEQTFSELLGDYKLPKKASAMKCARSQCRQPHWYGFVARTASGKVVPIGNVCGTEQFGAAFDYARDAFNDEIERQSREDEAKRRFERTRQLRNQAELLLSPGGSVESFERAMQSFLDQCSARIAADLYERALRGQAVIEVDRELTKDERDALPQTGKKRPRFVTEVVGRLDGLQALKLPRPRDLLQHQMLSGITRFDDETPGSLAGNKQLYRQQLDFVSRLEDSMRTVEGRLEAGARFFQTNNLRLLRFLAQDAEERNLLARLLWDTGTGEVIAARAAAA